MVPARLALVLCTAAFLAGCGGTKTETKTKTVTVQRPVTVEVTVTGSSPTTAAACPAGALHATFDVVPGSAGAGNIVYRLRVTNTGSSPCVVSGLPAAKLLDANGAPLPTRVRAAQLGTQTAVRVTLASGDAATADARFSPDVPGVGETTPGRCEPIAATLRVTVEGATVDAPIKPPTSVCERGSLSFSVYTAAH
jgi:hypothetical protein